MGDDTPDLVSYKMLDEYNQMAILLENMSFELDEGLADEGFFFMKSTLPYNRALQLDLSLLTSIAAYAHDKMTLWFKGEGRQRPWGYYESNFLVPLSVWKRVKKPQAPNVVTAMAVNNLIYIASSVKTVGRKSVLSHHQSPQQNERILQTLYDAGLYDLNSERPILHHQTANCGEIAALRLYLNANPGIFYVGALRDALITTVQRRKDAMMVIAPCESCGKVLDRLKIDYSMPTQVVLPQTVEIVGENDEVPSRRSLHGLTSSRLLKEGFYHPHSALHGWRTVPEWIYNSAKAALSALNRGPGYWISLLGVLWIQIVALGAHTYRLLGRDLLHIERTGRRLRLWRFRDHVRSYDEAENPGVVIRSVGYGIDYQ